MEIAKGFGRLFYLISPNETAVEHVEDIPHPDHVAQATPYFLTLITLEYLIQWYKKKRRMKLNDGLTSLSHGMYLLCQEMLLRGVFNYGYILIYDNWRLYELPWDSPCTWYLTALGVDFGYYWVHRAAHEVNIFWAKHQVHHSSEYYNLTTALRQSAFQGFFGWPFYLPLAFFVPPSIFLIHQQFNLLFQFWIHTEVINDLGPIEYIFNTPKHHRIHHGSNRYCLDKNYAGVLIIWDRIFGTFAKEKKGEEIKYGLVEDVKSFNPFWLQFFYYTKIWRSTQEYKDWGDKLSVVFKGPGWSPGKPRLGDPLDVPEVPDRKLFNVKLPLWKNIYALFHFIVTFVGFEILSTKYLALNQFTVLACVGYILFSLTSIGLILEDRRVGVITEISRSLILIAFLLIEEITQNLHPLLSQVLLGIFGGSIGIWSFSLSLSSFHKVSVKKS